jgi:hypothetical protein
MLPSARDGLKQEPVRCSVEKIAVEDSWPEISLPVPSVAAAAEIIEE